MLAEARSIRCTQLFQAGLSLCLAVCKNVRCAASEVLCCAGLWEHVILHTGDMRWASSIARHPALLRVQVDHEGAIVFPKSAIGKVAIAEGKLGREELTQKEAIAAAEHEASENNREFDASTIKSGKVVYEIAGTGAIILDR